MAKQPENLKKKSNWGGKRKNAGRKLGKQNKATKEKLATLKEFKERVRKNANRLFNSQMSLAEGCSFLFCIKTIKKGNTSKRITKKVSDPKIIKAYLDDELDNKKDEYYFISTEKPDNRAIDSMLDRAFGRATQSMELGNKDGEAFTTKVIILPERNEKTKKIS